MRLILVLSVSCVLVDQCELCRDYESKLGISYALIKFDARSTEPVLTRKRVKSVQSCKNFAESRQALAFNYEDTNRDSSEPNCRIFRCPETGNALYLANVTGVDYYSAYLSEPYKGNGSLFCVGQVGLFVVFWHEVNFTKARSRCRRLRGVLADVSDEARTRGLASVTGDKPVYVGLSNQGKPPRIWKNELGEPLFCSEYRAWDTGEPSHSRGCATLFRKNRKSEPVWRVVPCSSKLPYVCELPRHDHALPRD